MKNPEITNYPTTNLFKITGKKHNKNNIEKLLKLNFENEFIKFYKK